MNTNQSPAEVHGTEREKFETRFPKPNALTWNGSGYDCEDGWENSYTINAFCAKWSGWQARAALESQAQPKGMLPVLRAETRLSLLRALDGCDNAGWLSDREIAEVKAALSQAPAPAPQRLPLAQATAPRKIWLQSSGVEFDMAEPFPDNHEGITWCEDEIGDGDVPYIRADLAVQATAVGYALLPLHATQEMQDAGRQALVGGGVPLAKVWRVMAEVAAAHGIKDGTR